MAKKFENWQNPVFDREGDRDRCRDRKRGRAGTGAEAGKGIVARTEKGAGAGTRHEEGHEQGHLQVQGQRPGKNGDRINSFFSFHVK